MAGCLQEGDQSGRVVGLVAARLLSGSARSGDGGSRRKLTNGLVPLLPPSAAAHSPVARLGASFQRLEGPQRLAGPSAGLQAPARSSRRLSKL